MDDTKNRIKEDHSPFPENIPIFHERSLLDRRLTRYSHIHARRRLALIESPKCLKEKKTPSYREKLTIKLI